MALTPKQKIFADEYLIDLNATRAYKVAYPRVRNEETAAAAGARLLRNVKVEDYIQKRMDERAQRTEITQDRVLQELAKIGFANITDFVTIEGGLVRVKPTNQMPRDKLGVIAAIKEGANGIEVKLNDKEKALELIGRHLGMFKDKLELTGGLDTEKTKLDDLLQQMRGGG